MDEAAAARMVPGSAVREVTVGVAPACVFPPCTAVGVPITASRRRFCGRCGRPLGGSRLGPERRYQVSGFLGSGYYADVFRAVEVETGLPYAAKVYRGGVRRTRAAIREQEALRSLSHHRLPALRDSFREGDRTFVVMELVGGASLRHDVETRGPFAAGQVVALAVDLCEVFEYIAAREWTYRDLHPRNVHRDTPKGTMLLDLDGARPPHWPAQPAGRIGYRAPELARGGDVTPACDVYSLAGCLYFALTGRDPPPEPGPLAGLRGPLSAPSSLAGVLDACRSPEPEQRPSARALRARLEATAR